MRCCATPGAGAYVGGALSAKEVGRFFAAAAVLFAAAPWKFLDDSMVLRLDIETLGRDEARVSPWSVASRYGGKQPTVPRRSREVYMGDGLQVVE